MPTVGCRTKRHPPLSWLKLILLCGMSSQKFRTIETLFPLKKEGKEIKAGCDYNQVYN